jgi:ABC-2 type transport system permease protein
MEELYSRNLGHLFVSPLRPFELLIAMMTMSMLRVVIGVIPAMLLAILFYEYNIFTLGLPLIGFFVNLMAMGWVIGLVVVGILIRSGLGAESLAWLLVFAMAPISAIYYPVWTLPDFLQAVALFVPAAHVFEGMRALIVDGTFDAGEMLWAVVLNAGYLLLAGGFCLWMIRRARIAGRILQSGE